MTTTHPPQARRPPRRLEEAEQIALFDWAEHVTIGPLPLPPPSGGIGARRLSTILTHVPNGGARSKPEAARFKAMGVQPGFPDLLLPIATRAHPGGLWELKAGRNRLEPTQIAWHALLRASGYYVQTYWRWSECAADILRYLDRGDFTVIVRAKL
jgi:hypothetical protein